MHRFLEHGRCQPLVTNSHRFNASSDLSSFKRSHDSADPLLDSKRHRVDSAEAPNLFRDVEPEVPQQRAPTNTGLAEPPVVGQTRLHASHTLAYRDGVIICLRCGYYAVSKAARLAVECKPLNVAVRSRGQEALSRWRRGLLPFAKMALPEILPTLPEGIIWRSRVS